MFYATVTNSECNHNSLLTTYSQGTPLPIITDAMGFQIGVALKWGGILNLHYCWGCQMSIVIFDT